MINVNYDKEVKANTKNFYMKNPINPKDTKKKRYDGHLISERFYIIDFLDIEPNRYVISSFGRFFDLKTKSQIKLTRSSSGYLTATIRTADNKRKCVQIHRLVARAFVPKTTNDKKHKRYFVRHKDGSSDYNVYWNLVWANYVEIKAMCVASDPNSTESDIVKQVCRLLREGISKTEILRVINYTLSPNLINKIQQRKIYTEISENYEF